MRRRVSRSLLIAATICLVACASTQSRFSPLGGVTYPPKPATFEVAVFQAALPTQPFERIARLDAHFEKTVWANSTLDEALVELKKQARAAGADAIVEIKEQRSGVGETKIYHVTATAVRYTSAQ